MRIVPGGSAMWAGSRREENVFTQFAGAGEELGQFSICVCVCVCVKEVS
jgi:hypothetical protein